MTDKQWENLTASFLKVCEILKEKNKTYAFHMAYKQQWKFYKEHTTEEAASILIQKYPDVIA